MLRREPGAFVALRQSLGDPGFSEIGLAEPPTAAEGLEAVRF
jgi:hypothetical protein